MSRYGWWWRLGTPAALGVGPIGSKNRTQRKQHTGSGHGIPLVVVPAVVLLTLVLLATFARAAPDQFATQVLADGPIGYWRFNEASLSDGALDRSGRPIPINGTYSATGITLGQPAPAGGDPAALFDGTSGRVIVPNSDILNPSHITMEAKVAWFGPKGQPIQQRILEKSSFPELAQYGLSVTAAGHVRVELRTSSATTSVDVESIVSVARAVETHVVATYDGQSIRIYLNGLLDSEFPAPGSISPKPPTPANLIESGLGIGNQTQRDRPFNGIIDEVALYDRALSANRILAHYQSQFEGPAFHYAVKFVCGKSDGRIVASGEYFTAINVHNPTNGTVGFKKKFVIAGRYEKPGPKPVVSSVPELPSDFATEIDCEDIFKHFAPAGQPTAFLKGFVVIESAVDLDVVAVYTAAGATGRVETMEIERVKPRRQVAEGKPDLVPIPDPPGNFCRLKSGKLLVEVKNQGTASASFSNTTVEFRGGESPSQPTRPIDAGRSVELLFDIPASCFKASTDCPFKVIVDSNNQVDESNETNNTAVGVCPG